MRLQTGMYVDVPHWDLIIAHPPCTYLSNVATGHHSLNKSPMNWINARTEQRIDAMRFFMRFANANCDKIAIENPVGIMNTAYRKPDQVIHPWMFAETDEEYVTKATCLWLKGLPALVPTNIVDPGEFYVSPKGRKFSKGSSSDAARDETGKILSWNDPRTALIRSKTYEGIARAMAEQWAGKFQGLSDADGRS